VTASQLSLLHLQVFLTGCTDGEGWPTAARTDILQEMKALPKRPPVKQELHPMVRFLLLAFAGERNTEDSFVRGAMNI
jgi:hypothetical protein